MGLRFPEDEFESRIGRVRKRMDEDGIDVLLVLSSPGSMRYGQRGHVMYLSGYEPYFGNAMMLLPADDGVGPLLQTDEADYSPSGITWVDNVVPAGDPVRVITDFLDASGIRSPSVGVVGEYSARPELLDRVRARLEGRVTCASRLLERERAVKSGFEIAAIGRAADIARAGFEAVADAAEPGRTEAELVSEAERACREAGSEGFPHHTMVTSGSDADHLSRWWYCGERRLEAGDAFNLDIGTMCDGYCCDIARSFSLGGAERRRLEAYAVLSEVFEAARRACRPGVMASEVNEAALEAVDGRLEGDFTGIGHGVGLEVHEWPFVGYQYISGDDAYRDMRLERDMVVSLEPQVTLEGIGYLQLEDEVVVTDSGGRTVSEMPHEIIEC